MVKFFSGIIFGFISVCIIFGGLGTLLAAAIPKPLKEETIKDHKDKAIIGGVLSFFGLFSLIYIFYKFPLE